MNMIMPLVKADGKAEYALLEQLTSRSGEVDRKVTAAVSAILDGVRSRGMTPCLSIRGSLTGWIRFWNPSGGTGSGAGGRL